MLTSDGKKAVTVMWVLTPLSTIFLGLRLARRRKLFGVDDWLLCFALLMLYVQITELTLAVVKGGYGKHMIDLTQEEMTWLFKMIYWSELAYTISVSTIKISVLISYNGIFGGLRWFRYAVFVLGALASAWFIGVFLSIVFQCIPVDKAWNILKPGHCIELINFLWGNSISNTILDYCILLLPVLPVLKLRMARVQKALVLASFSLGSLASISSTVRAVHTGVVDVTNISGTLFDDSVWTIVEPNAGVLSACLPYLANVFGKGLFDGIKRLSNILSGTSSLFGFRRTPDNSTASNPEPAKSSTQRAAYEAYDLNDNSQQCLPNFRDKGLSEDSVRSLV